MNIVERRRPQDGQFEVDGRRPRRSTSASRPSPRSGARRRCCGSSTSSRSLLAARPSSACRPRPQAEFSQLIRSPFGMVICAGPTGSGKTTTLYAALQRDQRLRAQHHDDRRPGRVRVPVDQPDPDQRAGRHHVRRRAQGDPAPGPRHHPRRRDPRRRDRPHRGAVGAHRSLRALVAARHRRHRARCTASSTWASSRSSSRRRSSASWRSASCAASATACREPYEPVADELAFYEQWGGEAQGASSSTARAATSARGTGYSSASASTSCCRSPDEIKQLIVRHAPLDDVICAMRDRRKACARCATRRCGSSKKTSRRSPRCCAASTSS